MHVLARYSAEFWNHHVQKIGGEKEETIQAAMDLLWIDNPAYLAWIQLRNPDLIGTEPSFDVTLEETATPVYYMSLFGLSRIANYCLTKAPTSTRKSDGTATHCRQLQHRATSR